MPIGVNGHSHLRGNPRKVMANQRSGSDVRNGPSRLDACQAFTIEPLSPRRSSSARPGSGSTCAMPPERANRKRAAILSMTPSSATTCCASAIQHLDPEQQIAFTAQFGTLERHMARNRGITNGQSACAYLVFPNLGPDDASPAARLLRPVWHSDKSFRREPSLATILHAQIMPPEGGETCFANMIATRMTLCPTRTEARGTRRRPGRP